MTSQNFNVYQGTLEEFLYECMQLIDDDNPMTEFRIIDTDQGVLLNLRDTPYAFELSEDDEVRFFELMSLLGADIRHPDDVE